MTQPKNQPWEINAEIVEPGYAAVFINGEPAKHAQFNLIENAPLLLDALKWAIKYYDGGEKEKYQAVKLLINKIENK